MVRRRKKMQQKRTYAMISGLLAVIAAMAYWNYALVAAPEGVLGVHSLGNIKCYAVLVMLLVFFFLGFYMFFYWTGLTNKSIDQMRYVLAAAGIGAVIYLLLPHIKTVWEFPVWVTVGMGAFFTVFLCAGLCSRSKNLFSVFFLILLFGLLWGVAMATVNTFRSAPHGAFYDLHHTSAYMDSIFNVYRHMGYEGGLTDQYGHYGLFFYLPLKIFGCSSATVAVILGILAATVYILCMTSFCMVVRNTMLQIAVICIAGIAGLNPALGSIYWQCYPHRLVFPAITIFMITFFSRRGMKMWQYVTGCVVIALALLWNFESGIICSAAWFVYSIVFMLQKGKMTKKKLLFCGIFLLADVVVPFLLAVGSVNLYNLIAAGSEAKFLGVRDFVGMVVDDNYITQLQTDLAWGNEFYIHKILVFLLCFCWGIYHNRVFGIRGNEAKANCSIAVSVMGLGLLTYYMNRTLAGHALVNLFFILCLGFIVSGAYELAVVRWNLKRSSFAGIGKAVCGLYACLLLAGCGMANLTVYSNFQEKYSTGVYDYDKFEGFVSQIGQAVPEDTWAKGEGTTAIYMELGRNNKAYEFGDVIAEEMQEHDRIFVIDRYFPSVPDDFQMVQQFAYNDVVFGYFVRKQ